MLVDYVKKKNNKKNLRACGGPWLSAGFCRKPIILETFFTF